MATRIQILRSTGTSVPDLANGELAWVGGSQRLYVGMGGVEYLVGGPGAFAAASHTHSADDVVVGVLPAVRGGTGVFAVTVGDLLVGSAVDTWSRLSGNTSTSRRILSQVGSGSASAVPSWFDLFGTVNTWTAAQNFASAGGEVLACRVSGEAHPRFRITGAGVLSFGPGSSAVDLNVNRDGNGRFQVGGDVLATGLLCQNGAYHTGFVAPTLSASRVWTLPAADGSNGQALVTNGSGVLSWATMSGGASGANPSATIGLTAVNGSAGTFMRSDAAPALSVAISPVWTANHAFQKRLALQQTVNSAGFDSTHHNVDFGEGGYVKITGAIDDFVITGIVGGGNGQVLVIHNDTVHSMTLNNMDGGSAAANRINVVSGSCLPLTAAGVVTLIYDSDASCWVVIAVRD